MSGLTNPAGSSARRLVQRMLLALALGLAAVHLQGPVQAQQPAANAGSGGVLDKLRGMAGMQPETPQFLRVEQAFALRAEAVDAHTLVASFEPVAGYYLYRDKFAFALEQASGVAIDGVELPRGEVKDDPNFGRTEVFYRPVQAVIRLQRSALDAQPLVLQVQYQGCADAGLCYPPETRRFPLMLSAADGSAPAATASRLPGPPPDEGSRIAGMLSSGSTWLVLASFFGFGLLLAFTPCVLPMIPILSGIIVGRGHQVTRRHAFLLSAAYVIGMALTYAAAGVAAGLSGTLLSAALQNPWVLGSFALLFVLLALSMFGFYELQVPSALQSRLSSASNRLHGGTLWGVFAMGVLSALIVGPCVAAPLAGALLYINHTRDAVLGGGALFAMALGMGVPLLAVGLSAGSLLPRAGPWMQTVKNFFGVLLLGMAIWMVSPVIPTLLHMLAWAVLLIVSAIYLHAIDPLPHNAPGYRRLWKGVGVIALVVGVALLIGALAGGRDILQPLSALRPAVAGARQVEGPRFEKIASLGELERTLAQSGGRPVMLDFYADWCISCKEMERFTFTDPAVRARMDRLLLLKADVTHNNEDDRALLQRFGLFGPPGMIFFDAYGRELPGRVIGFQAARRFAASLDAILPPGS
ncbi:MAG: protein-disulfide reductase DsbD [Burkholderiales bacterium]|nr:protein-disulfide reductase DsbD [Burkholderiales bacterium]